MSPPPCTGASRAEGLTQYVGCVFFVPGTWANSLKFTSPSKEGIDSPQFLVGRLDSGAGNGVALGHTVGKGKTRA